jgi:hypothetical protein
MAAVGVVVTRQNRSGSDMSGIIAIPNKQNWSVGMRWFGQPLAIAESAVDDPDDRYVLRQASAFQWIELASRTEPQRTRLALALLRAALQLDIELRTPPIEFARDIDSADQLLVLAGDLRDWLDAVAADDLTGPA